jgi:hypothetical protein
VPKQAFIGVSVTIRRIQSYFNRAAAMRRGKHFIHQPPAERSEIERLWIEAQAARFDAAEEQHFLH